MTRRTFAKVAPWLIAASVAVITHCGAGSNELVQSSAGALTAQSTVTDLRARFLPSQDRNLA